MNAFSPTDVQALATELMRQLQNATGRSGGRNFSTDDGATPSYQRALKNLRGETDSVSNRMSGFNQSIQRTMKHVDDLAKQVREANTGANFKKLKEQSNTASSALNHVESALTDTAIAVRKYPEALHAATKDVGANMKLFSDILGDHNIIKSSEDFKNVSQLITQEMESSRKSALQGTRDFAEWNELIKNTIDSQDLTDAHEGMVEAATQVNEHLQKFGVATKYSSEQFKTMSFGRLQEFMKEVKSQKLMTEALKNGSQGLNTLNSNAANAGNAMLKLDKSVITLSKDMAFDKIFGKLGMGGTDIENLKAQGFNMSTFLKFLLSIVSTIGLKLINETREIAKAAMETGVAPMAKTALKLWMSASDFQRIIGQQSQAAFGGAQGIEKVTAALEKNQSKYFELTGDPKLAAELNMKVINFSKSFTEGTENLNTASQQWGEHLGTMQTVTGKSTNELMGLYEAQFQSAEMQDVLNKLDGVQQQKMIAGIRTRSVELAAMGMTAEKAVETAAGLEKLRAQSTPERIKGSMVLARNAMMLGMSRENAMRLQHLRMTNQLNSDEGKRLLQELGTFQRNAQQKATGMLEGGMVGAGNALLNLVEKTQADLDPQTQQIVKAFESALESQKGKGQDLEDARQRRMETTADTYVQAGTLFEKAVHMFKAASGNILGVGELLGPAAAGLGIAVAGLLALKGSSILKGGISSVLGKTGLGKVGEWLGKGKPPTPPTGTLPGPGGKGVMNFAKGAGKFALKSLPVVGSVFEGYNAIESLINGNYGQAAGHAGLAALGLIPGFNVAKNIAQIGGGLALNAFSGTGNTSKEKASVTPITPSASVTPGVETFMELQERQNQQMITMNKNLQTIASAIKEGNSFASQTTQATRDLADAYYSVESQNLNAQAIIAGGQFREKMYAGSNVRPIHVT